nr:putative ribonuclease h protein [Quercus suber]
MWNSGLIDQIFFPWEAESIKNMPVSFRTDSDLLTWPWTADGGYSVKSAYQILANEALSSQAGSSNPEASKILWSGIWKLKVPNKVKHFMWRASNESLPTKFNLCARHVLPDNRCSLCDECPEDVIHSLWLCDHAKSIWFSDQAFHHPRTRTFRCFGDLMTFVLTELSSSTAALFSMVAWCIWTRRNNLRERQPVWDVGVTVKRARELLQEFMDVQVTPTRLPIPQEKVKWKPPGAGLFKINFDGAVFEDKSLAGLGIVIRDEFYSTMNWATIDFIDSVAPQFQNKQLSSKNFSGIFYTNINPTVCN